MIRKNIIVISDSFFPNNSSVSVQIYDLACQFFSNGYNVYLILPSHLIKENYLIKKYKDINLIYLKTFNIKNRNYFLRALSEFMMPFCMIKNFKKQYIGLEDLHGIVCYSPSIFFGIFTKYLKKIYTSKSYLIIRDLFPQWAADIDLISSKSLIFKFFKLIDNYQLSNADFIGIQSIGNINFFKQNLINKIEVLPNWLNSEIKSYPQSKSFLNKINFKYKTIITYTGNIGIAQGFEVFFDVIKSLKLRKDILFIIVGKGNNFNDIKNQIKTNNIQNVLIFDEVSPNDLFYIYNKTDIGLVSLDTRHKTHNIPGKFINYLKHSLPVFINCNPGNDLIKLVNHNSLGFAMSSNNPLEIRKKFLAFLLRINKDKNIKNRCRKFFNDNYRTEIICKQILSKLDD